MIPNIEKFKRLIYLDAAASTPVLPEVLSSILPFFSEKFGNPSSLYSLGVQAKAELEKARSVIAEELNCTSSEIIFTSGGTESINLGLLGVVRKFIKQQKSCHIITTKIEHSAVLECMNELVAEGAVVDFLPVDSTGLVDVSAVDGLVCDDTVLVSVQYANNEVGTIQKIGELGKIISGINKVRAKKILPKIVFHTDACQATSTLSLNVEQLGVDLLSANASKIGGPKQSGILYCRRGVSLLPLIFGGGQERGLRSGTESLVSAVGFASALTVSRNSVGESNTEALRNYLWDGIQKFVEGVELNGPLINSSENGRLRLQNNLNVYFEGVLAEDLMFYLDSYNIAVSTGSACDSGSLEGSYVLREMGFDVSRAKASVRFSLLPDVTFEELDYVIEVLRLLVPEIRKTSGLANLS